MRCLSAVKIERHPSCDVVALRASRKLTCSIAPSKGSVHGKFPMSGLMARWQVARGPFCTTSKA